MAPCFSFENNCLCSVTLPVCRIGLILIHRYVVIHRLINSKIIFAQLHKSYHLNYIKHIILKYKISHTLYRLSKLVGVPPNPISEKKSQTEITDEKNRRKLQTKISDENFRRKSQTKISDENFR